MKSNSYKIATALRGCSVRFEKRAREFVLVARLIYVAKAKASMKMRESLGTDPKPDDLIMSKAKFIEIWMEA